MIFQITLFIQQNVKPETLLAERGLTSILKGTQPMHADNQVHFKHHTHVLVIPCSSKLNCAKHYNFYFINQNDQEQVLSSINTISYTQNEEPCKLVLVIPQVVLFSNKQTDQSVVRVSIRYMYEKVKINLMVFMF